MSAVLKQESSVIKFPSKRKSKGIVVDNYESIKSSYGYLARADRAGNLSAIEKQVLDLCLQLTAKEGWACVNYHFLQKKVWRSRDTIKRILNSISNIVSWEFRRSVEVNGIRRDNQVIIRRTENTQKILSNAEEKLSDNQVRVHGVKSKSACSSTQNYAPLHIDNKRGIEDNPLKRVISSIPDNKEKKENQSEQKSAVRELSEDLPCCEAASHSSSSEAAGAEKQSKQEIAGGMWRDSNAGQSLRPSAKILPFTAKEEQEHYQKHASRRGQSDQEEREFTLIGEVFSNIQLEKHKLELSSIERDQGNRGWGSTENKNEIKEAETKQEKEEVKVVAIGLKETNCISWDLIRKEALNSLEHEADKWSLKYELNELEVSEDDESRMLQFKGSDYAIKSIRKHHYQVFRKSFYKVLPDYTFEFVAL